MGGKSGVSGLAGGISSDHEVGKCVRLLLLAAVESIEPAEDSLERIRARLGQHPRRAAGRLACRRAAEMQARQRPRCRGWPGS
ncbi:MAG TPA: hypothetical protein VEH31_00955 [Streptosporangiaceae bacterium]|nr:hypothetical protein [Streptosporangiaceae bacterium]